MENAVNDTSAYLKPGDMVQVIHEIPYRPLMIVSSIDKEKKENGLNVLLGVTCFWFDTEFRYHSQRFSTKDVCQVVG